MILIIPTMVKVRVKHLDEKLDPIHRGKTEKLLFAYDFPKETVTVLMILYKSTKVTPNFDNVAKSCKEILLYIDLRPGQTCHSKVMGRNEVTHSDGSYGKK